MSQRLTRKESTALLLVAYQDIKHIFESLNRLRTLNSGRERREQLITLFEHILVEDLECADLENPELFELFNPKS